MTARVERVVTSGAASPDGDTDKIDRGVWLVGDDEEVIVVDASYDADAILTAVGDRQVLAVVCMHGYRDHVEAAVDVAERDEALIAVHIADRMLWDEAHPDHEPDVELEHGGALEVAEQQLQVVHTPGHSPGGVSLYAPELGVVFVGDTLTEEGPGTADSSYADFPNLLTSIGERLLTLPSDTRVLPARGEETTVAVQDDKFDQWVADGGPEQTSRK